MVAGPRIQPSPVGGADVYLLADPAGERGAEAVATAVVVDVDKGAVEIRLTASRGTDASTRLLWAVVDALRAQGVCRARLACGSLCRCGAAAVAAVGFSRHGDWFEMEM